MNQQDILDAIYVSQMATRWFTAKEACGIVQGASLKEVYDALQSEVRESQDKVAQLVRNRDKYQWIVKK